MADGTIGNAQVQELQVIVTHGKRTFIDAVQRLVDYQNHLQNRIANLLVEEEYVSIQMMLNVLCQFRQKEKVEYNIWTRIVRQKNLWFISNGLFFF